MAGFTGRVDNDSHNFKVTSQCGCSKHFTKRDIIDIAFEEIMENVASTITSALLNLDMFGEYSIPYLFIFLDYTYNHCSPQFVKALSLRLQYALDVSMEVKKKRTQCYVLEELAGHVGREVLGRKPFLSDSFREGIPQQVSSETYGFAFCDYDDEQKKYSNNISVKCKQNEKDVLLESDHAFQILEYGQAIPNKGFSMVFYCHLPTYTPGYIEIRKFALIIAIIDFYGTNLF
jgi:hypothetical protein